MTLKLKRGFEIAAFIATLIFAVVMLVYEAAPPITAFRFMLALHVWSWPTVSVMAPLALGALVTLAGLGAVAVIGRREVTQTMWVWAFIAAFVAPVLAMGGGHLAVRLLAKH